MNCFGLSLLFFSWRVCRRKVAPLDSIGRFQMSSSRSRKVSKERNALRENWRVFWIHFYSAFLFATYFQICRFIICESVEILFDCHVLDSRFECPGLFHDISLSPTVMVRVNNSWGLLWGLTQNILMFVSQDEPDVQWEEIREWRAAPTTEPFLLHSV